MTQDKGRYRGMSTGAAFLMAVSAIGPGFLTQTTTFTIGTSAIPALGATLAFAILLSILIDIGAQLNTWRVICISGKRGNELADVLLPGLGWVVSGVILFGSFAFNLGNLIGCAQGMEELLGLPRWAGASISASIAVGLFLLPAMLRGMDWFSKLLGFGMLAMMGYIVVITAPPISDAAREAFFPSQLDAATFNAIITLVGGTIGGYIMFSGAHRLLDGGVRGEENLGVITWASIQGILITGVMRSLLFLAVLGVVHMGVSLTREQEGRAVFVVFQTGAGDVGFYLAALIFWSAAITSVVGCSYTAITFTSVTDKRKRSSLIVGFILLTLIVTLYLIMQKVEPVTLLILAGLLNGALLPVVLGVVLVAAHSPRLMGNYRHPLWASIAGGLAWVATLFFAYQFVVNNLGRLLSAFTAD